MYGGLIENVIWGRGWRGLAENDRIPSYRGKESKIAQKNRHMIFERSLSGFFTRTHRMIIKVQRFKSSCCSVNKFSEDR